MLPDHLARFADKIPVLDKGFVRLVDVMGDDGAIIEAARVSTGKGRTAHDYAGGTMGLVCKACGMPKPMRAIADREDPPESPCIEGDRRFIDYMLREGHHSPFEMAEIKLHVRMPIFVARQWIRHRTANVNEYSGRYSKMIDEVFALAPDEWRGQDIVNKQGSTGVVTEWPKGYRLDRNLGGVDVDIPGGRGFHVSNGSTDEITPGTYLSKRQEALQAEAREVYEERLAFGVSRELARVDMPVGNYTEWYWKIDLRNLLHFLGLRMDQHAQPEIRAYANAIARIVAAWCPLTWRAFEKHRLNATTLSADAAAFVRDWMQMRDMPMNATGTERLRFDRLDKADRAVVLELLGAEALR